MASEAGFTYEVKGEEVTLLSYEAEEKRVEVPPRIASLPVTALGDYALAGKDITSLLLPAGLRKMGRYCLYDCQSLQSLSFTDTPLDLGAGAFTGCHHLKELSVTFLTGGASALREVLMEVAEELLVTYRCPEGEGLFLFPAFFEEGVENTPARIIEHHTHGSGMLYRNCFVNRRLVFSEYDRRFGDARGEEGETLLVRLCAGRLRYPLFLEETYRQAYAAYLREHFEAALDYYAQEQDAAMRAFLMQWHHEGGRGKRRSFAL